MALINRFEVVNFLDSGSSEEWNPDFRHNIFHLNCLSSAIVMENGTGKTRIVNALLAILSRKKSLITETKAFMAPPRPGIAPTHIRIELVLKKTLDPYQQQPLLNEMYDTLGENWVMGICGYKGEDTHFYYYHGTLEETNLIAEENPEQMTIITQGEFREKLKLTRSNQFGVSRQDWLERIKHFIPPYHLNQMVEFHKSGGGDKAAELYKIKPQGNERYDQALFYEHIAPNLLAGVMGSEGDEDEYHFEETIFKSSEKIINAQFKTREAQDHLYRIKNSYKNLGSLVELAREIKKTRQEYQKYDRELREAAECIKFLMEKVRIPGIPKQFDSGDEAVGRLLNNIVIIPGKGTALKDTGMAELFQKAVAHINEKAENLSSNNTRSLEIILLPLNSEIRKHGKAYSQSAISDFIDKTNDDYFPAPKSGLKDIIFSAFNTFEENSDTSPFRKACKEIEAQLYEEETVLHDLNQELFDIKNKINELKKELYFFEQGKTAFQRLWGSGLFAEHELEQPMDIKDQAEEDSGELNNRKSQYIEEKSRMEIWEESWKTFAEIYGDDSDPGIVQSHLKEEIKRTERAVKSAKNEQEELRRQEKRVRVELAQLQQVIKENETNFNLMDMFHLRTEKFQKNYPDEKPEQVQDRVDKQRRELEKKEFQVSEKINKILDDLKRQLKILKKQKLAPGKTAQDAFDALPKDISKKFLYEVINGQNIPHDRKQALLTLFSPILFSPVVRTLTDGVQATQSLREKDIPVTVFLKDELIRFIRKGDICYDSSGKFAYTFWIGEQTNIVDCILNPEKIEQEKEKISERIRKIEDILALNDTISVKKIRQAFPAKQEQGLQDIISEYGKTRDELKKHNTQYNKEFMACLNGAEEFYKLGGFSRYSQYKAALEKQLADETQKNDILYDIERQIDSLGENIDKFQEDLNKINEQPQIDFKSAILFSKKGGTSTVRQIEDELQKIEEKLETIGQKLRFNFEQIEEYMKNRQSGEQIEKDIEILNEKSDQTDEEKSESEKNILALERKKNDLESASSRYDQALTGIFDEYKYAVHFAEGSDITGNENLEQLKTLYNQLADKINDIDRFNEIVTCADDIHSFVKELAVRNKESGRAGVKQTLNLEENNYTRKCHDLVESQLDGFSTVEKARIMETQNNPDRIIALSESFESNINEKETELKEYADMESRMMSNLIERLVKFADGAKHNLTILRKVCSKNKVATFDISAKIPAEDEMKQAISRIIGELEQRHEYYQRKRDAVLTNPKEQDKSDLDFIRRQIYRDIFNQPSVKIIHPNIQQGKKVLFTSKVSTGEQAGIALMMMTRLAEFAKMKYIEKNRAYSYASKQKLKHQEMGFMLIDGLFSTLSKEDIINNSLESLKYVQGDFQLIGFIHNLAYRHNFKIFPSYIVGKKYVTMDQAGSKSTWVENRSIKEEEYKKTGTIGTFQASIKIRDEMCD
ncbi:MAG: hypothetical protein GY749_09430 [Desulfobacteraceae bacterium]|nr:hypothetical protein [Desulfobacteraceae bacterium]